MSAVDAAAAFDVAGYLASEREAVEAALERALDAAADRVPARLLPAIRHGVTGGGKRLRPVLCVTAWRACGGEGAEDAAHDLGASLEMIHGYSLMHDDLPCMDDAELRRGRPTTHRVHGEAETVVAGAALIPLAVLRALESARALGRSDGEAREIAAELARAAGAGGMVGGQALDLMGEGRALGEAELGRLHRLKTGALLTAALRMGARGAGAEAPALAALDAYGRAVGLAFQIADDVLDATATAEALGKRPSDAALDKSTYVALHGLDGARRLARAEVDRARSALDDAGLPAPALHALAEYVVRRER